MRINHKVHTADINGFHVIELLDGEFAGFKFTYHDVSFADQENEDGSITLSFSYTAVDGVVPPNESVLKQILGDLLLQMIEDQLDKSEVVYHGGTD